MDLDTVLSAIYHLSRNNKSFVLKQSNLQNFKNIPYDERYTDLLRLILFLALIDSYDAWVYLRASVNVPEIPAKLWHGLVSGEVSGSSLKDIAFAKMSEVSLEYSIDSTPPAERIEMLRRVMTAYHWRLSELQRVHKQVEYFNFLRYSTGLPVLFGTRPRRDYDCYMEYLHSANACTSAKSTLSSFYGVKFSTKLQVVTRMIGSSAEYSDISVYTIDRVQRDFYVACECDMDRVVAIMRNNRSSVPVISMDRHT